MPASVGCPGRRVWLVSLSRPEFHRSGPLRSWAPYETFFRDAEVDARAASLAALVAVTVLGPGGGCSRSILTSPVQEVTGALPWLPASGSPIGGSRDAICSAVQRLLRHEGWPGRLSAFGGMTLV